MAKALSEVIDPAFQFVSTSASAAADDETAVVP